MTRIELALVRDAAGHWRRLVARRIRIGRHIEDRRRLLHEDIRVHAAGVGDKNAASKRCGHGRETGNRQGTAQKLWQERHDDPIPADDIRAIMPAAAGAKLASRRFQCIRRQAPGKSMLHSAQGSMIPLASGVRSDRSILWTTRIGDVFPGFRVYAKLKVSHHHSEQISFRQDGNLNA
jgi:hypothetical protein